MDLLGGFNDVAVPQAEVQVKKIERGHGEACVVAKDIYELCSKKTSWIGGSLNESTKFHFSSVGKRLTFGAIAARSPSGL